MKKHTRLLLAALSFVLLLQSGCASLANSRPQRPPWSRNWPKPPRAGTGAGCPFIRRVSPDPILRIAIPAGTRLKTHLHPVINAGVLLSGQLTVVAQDGKTLLLKAGDPIVELVNTAHYGVNEGDEPAEIIVFYAGTTGAPITVSQTK